VLRVIGISIIMYFCGVDRRGPHGLVDRKGCWRPPGVPPLPIPKGLLTHTGGPW
jgi:hypothetical protein